MRSELVAALLYRVRPVKTKHSLIRLGGRADGGYLLPDDIADIDACFSPGVDQTASFEQDLIKRNIPCFLADYSVERAPFEHSLINFKKKFLGLHSDSVHIDLKTWVKECAATSKNLILQMDIEGAEYPILFHADLPTLLRFKILVIEFHGLQFIFDDSKIDTIFCTFDRLCRHFNVVHIHPNNCVPLVTINGISVAPVMEFTFLRKDAGTSADYACEFPHKLDSRNVQELDDIALPECWYTDTFAS
jgi:hypothetical protein